MHSLSLITVFEFTELYLVNFFTSPSNKVIERKAQVNTIFDEYFDECEAICEVSEHIN